MLSIILQTIRRHALFAPGDRVLVGVSGGPDSLALLSALWELAPRLKVSLEVATVDHGLRPVEGELALVRERAEALDLPWSRVAVDVRRGGISRGLQEAARRERLAALARLAAERGCRRVALGHQADDQAETVLFRIVRGTGLRGLAGIPYLREPFVRPLLDVTRAQIARYLRRRGLTCAHDPSNEDPRFARARLRQVVLPVLRRENPRIDEALRRLAAEAARAPLPSSAMASTARAAGVHLSARLERTLAQAAGGGGTRTFDVAGGHRLTVRYGRLTVTKQKPSAVRTSVPAEGASALPIRGAGRFSLGGATAVLVREADAPLPEGTDGLRWAWFDGDALGWPLALRVRQPGDRMRPRGGRGSRKLSDLLIDAKVPRDLRDFQAVVTSAEGELLYVAGLRPSQAAAPTKATRRLVGIVAVPIAGEANFTGSLG